MSESQKEGCNAAYQEVCGKHGPIVAIVVCVFRFFGLLNVFRLTAWCLKKYCRRDTEDEKTIRYFAPRRDLRECEWSDLEFNRKRAAIIDAYVAIWIVVEFTFAVSIVMCFSGVQCVLRLAFFIPVILVIAISRWLVRKVYFMFCKPEEKVIRTVFEL